MMKLRYRDGMFLAFCTIVSGYLLFQQAAADALASQDDARRAYFSAQSETKDITDAIEIIDSFQRAHTENIVAYVYKGSLRTLQARKASMPWKKMRYIGEGFQLLDLGCGKLGTGAESNYSPETKVEALIICGITNASVPKAYLRRPQARKELEKAIQIAEFQSLPHATQASVYAWLGVLYRSEQEMVSRRYFGLAQGLDLKVSNDIGRAQ